MLNNTMRFLIFILTTILFFESSQAQYNTRYFQDSTQRLSFSTEAGYVYGSSVMNNEFINKFIYGGKIDRNIKDNAYSKLSTSNNRIGGDLTFTINATIPFDTLFKKTNLALTVGVSHSEHFDAVFTDDLFLLAFDGNKQFAGEEAILSGTNMNYFAYQKVYFGISAITKKHGVILSEGFNVGIIKAQEHIALTIPSGSLFTEKDGKFIDLNINYAFNQTDTTNNKLSAFNGYGISTQVYKDFALKNGDKFHVEINDIGFIRMSKKALEYTANKTFNYDGIEVNSIFEINDSITNTISQDSLLDNIYTSKKQGSYGIALPTTVNISYTKTFNQKWKAEIGVFNRLLTNYFPYIYTNTTYYFSPNFLSQLHLSFGGYGKLNIGLSTAVNINNRVQICIGTNNLNAYIVPKSTFANSSFIGIKALF